VPLADRHHQDDALADRLELVIDIDADEGDLVSALARLLRRLRDRSIPIDAAGRGDDPAAAQEAGATHVYSYCIAPPAARKAPLGQDRGR
jgi:hypothetical protein